MTTDNLARQIKQSVREYFKDPQHQREFEKWKGEHDARKQKQEGRK